MGSIIVSLIVGAAAGALTARTIIRRELSKNNHVGEVAEAVKQESSQAQNLDSTQPVGQASIQPAASQPADEITPEILMVLTAAVSAFLGKKAKIRRARVSQYAGLSNAWAQQGRVFVQASHNLPSPHHTR